MSVAINELLDEVVAAAEEYVRVADTDREVTQRGIVHDLVTLWLDAMVIYRG